MNLTTEYLGGAQDDIRNAAQRVSEVVNRFTDKGDWGSQRTHNLIHALAMLNHSWSLVRSAVNEDTVPSVTPIVPSLLPTPEPKLFALRRPTRKRAV